MSVEPGVALARLTTIGTGGPARAYAEPRTLAELEEALRGARRARARGGRPSGSARTSSPPTTVSTRSCCVSRASWPRRGPRERLLAAGGGATNAVCLHRARAAGLGGLRVRLRDPRHRGRRRVDERRRLRQRLERDPRAGARRDAPKARAGSRPPSSGSRTGIRRSGTGRSSPPSSTGSSRATRTRSTRRVRELVARAQGDPADDEADVRLGVQEPAGRARGGADARAVRAKGYRVGGALISPEARELHRERGRRDDGRLSRADGRGPPPRARGSTASSSSTRWCCSATIAASQHGSIGGHALQQDFRTSSAAAKPVLVASGGRVERGSRSARARRASSSRCRDGSPASASISHGSCRRAARSPSRSSSLQARCSRGTAPGRRASSPCARSTSPARPAPVRAQVRHALADARGSSLLKVDLDRRAAGGRGARRPCRALASTARTRTRFASSIVPERPVAVVRQGADSYLVARAAGSWPTSSAAGTRRSRASGSTGASRSRLGATADGDLRTAVAAVAPLAGSHFPGRVSSVTTTPDELTLRLRSGLEVRLGDRSTPHSSSRSPPG